MMREQEYRERNDKMEMNREMLPGAEVYGEGEGRPGKAVEICGQPSRYDRTKEMCGQPSGYDRTKEMCGQPSGYDRTKEMCGQPNGYGRTMETCGQPGGYDSRNNLLGIAALVVGVIFVVLAGAIFTATTWWTMSDIARVMTILVLAGVFFAVSIAAEQFLGIRRTANACYLLGCFFLFLTVVAAGYFQLLGPWFSRENSIWYGWRIGSAGALVMTAVMILGIRRFPGGCYRQICLWSVTVNLMLLLKAFGVSGAGLVQMMAVYASLLAVLALTVKRLEKYRFFAALHFGVFILFLLKQCTGSYMFLIFGDTAKAFGTVEGNLCGLAAAAAAGGMLAWKDGRCLSKTAFQLIVLELIHFGAMGIPEVIRIDAELDQRFLAMAVLTAMFFLAGRRLVPQLCCTAGNVLGTVAVFWDTMKLVLLAICCFSAWKVQVELMASILLLAYMVREWGKSCTAARMLLPLVLWGLVLPAAFLLEENFEVEDTAKWITLVYAAALMVWDIVKRDVFGTAIAIISGIMLMAAAAGGDVETETVWLLIIGLYVLRFAKHMRYRQPALTASVILLTVAYLRQPWIRWPEILRLELFLLPIAADIYILGRIRRQKRGIGIPQTIGFTICLLILGIDAMATGQLADALILEGICLAVFLLAHIAGNSCWIRISGGFLLAVAIYMTKDFWLSIGWWVYLLAAGIGLILFAAVREKKRSRGGNAV